MIFNCNIMFIGINFSISMYCLIPGIMALCFNNRFWFMFIPGFMVRGSVMLADLPMDVLADSYICFYIQ